MSFYAVIGSNYGDEGKGMVTSFLAARSPETLVVRHNGGAQSGHTVETAGKRFVFHELSSGSFDRADTYWADSYYPDLFKLSEELESFRKVSGFTPRIYACTGSSITVIDDILVNMALEISRGDGRHGSCGMGINEADIRSKSGFAVSIGELAGGTAAALSETLRRIRKEYLPLRLRELGLEMSRLGEYGEILNDPAVIENFSETVMKNLRFVTPVSNEKSLFEKYENKVFESGQGLLLDGEYEPGFPNVTASRTGITNPVRILQKHALKLDEVFYVTRSYLTRHGAGSFPGECSPEKLGIPGTDATNVPNPWQGTIRWGEFESTQALLAPIKADLCQAAPETAASLVITHLNETGGRMMIRNSAVDMDTFRANPEINSVFHRIYESYSPFPDSIK